MTFPQEKQRTGMIIVRVLCVGGGLLMVCEQRNKKKKLSIYTR
jgi:hypothetical protein